MKKALYFSLIVLAVFTALPADACTSAIFTGKCTPDGRPLLWKHRDTGELNNRIEYFAAGADRKYSFTALVNSPLDEYGEAWAGTNETGFSIMNTASYNLQTTKADVEDNEGKVMFKALESCRTLKDFEKMLDKWKRPMGVEANFGVIDAEGGAAYYEVNNTEWTKVDVNDPKIAPEGFLIYTNHSYTGRINDGSGYIRYANAHDVVYDRWIKGGDFTPQWIFNNLSRCFYNSILGYDLKDTPEAVQNGWFIDQDFIPRRSTSASIVVKGVKPGENPELTVMWTVLGYPPCSIAVPVMTAAPDLIPACMQKTDDNENCAMCDAVLARRAKVFSAHRANAKNYFNYGQAMRYMRHIAPWEAKNFKDFEPVMEKSYSDGKLDKSALSEYCKHLHTALEL